MDTENQTLSVVIRGEVVKSNLPEFTKWLRGIVSGINLEPKTDEEFGEAETSARNLKKIESGLVAVKQDALTQAESLHALLSGIDEVNEEARQARLKLERVIKDKKEEIRADILKEAVESVLSVSKQGVAAEIEAAMKGKRTIDSLREAATSKVNAINEKVNAAREIIGKAKSENAGLVPDAERLELMSVEALTIEIERRKERIEAEEARKKAEEEARKAREEAQAAIAKAKADEDARKAEELQKAEEARKAEEASKAEEPAEAEEPEQSEDESEAEPEEPEAEPEDWQSETDMTEVSEIIEIRRFTATVEDAFSQVGPARQSLVTPKAKEVAKAFAQAVNAAYQQLKMEGGAE